MKLKIANSNGCVVVINSLHFLFLFPKTLKIDLNKWNQSLFYNTESITAHELKQLITFESVIKMEQLKAFYVYINLENQFHIFSFEKS